MLRRHPSQSCRALCRICRLPPALLPRFSAAPVILSDNTPPPESIKPLLTQDVPPPTAPALAQLNVYAPPTAVRIDTPVPTAEPPVVTEATPPAPPVHRPSLFSRLIQRLHYAACGCAAREAQVAAAGPDPRPPIIRIRPSTGSGAGWARKCMEKNAAAEPQAPEQPKQTQPQVQMQPQPSTPAQSQAESPARRRCHRCLLSFRRCRLDMKQQSMQELQGEHVQAEQDKQVLDSEPPAAAGRHCANRCAGLLPFSCIARRRHRRNRKNRCYWAMSPPRWPNVPTVAAESPSPTQPGPVTRKVAGYAMPPLAPIPSDVPTMPKRGVDAVVAGFILSERRNCWGKFLPCRHPPPVSQPTARPLKSRSRRRRRSCSCLPACQKPIRRGVRAVLAGRRRMRRPLPQTENALRPLRLSSWRIQGRIRLRRRQMPPATAFSAKMQIQQLNSRIIRPASEIGSYAGRILPYQTASPLRFRRSQ